MMQVYAKKTLIEISQKKLCINAKMCRKNKNQLFKLLPLLFYTPKYK